MHAHKGSGFDTWILLNNLTCERNICKVNKSGKGIIPKNCFNGYAFNDKNKFVPQYVYFESGMTHLYYSVKTQELQSNYK